MVVALVALVVALGGTAVAVSNSINGSQLKNRSVAGIKLKKHTVTGKEVNVGSLGQVPSALKAGSATSAQTATNALQLGGLGPSAFVQGGGHTFTVTGSANNGNPTPIEIGTIPGLAVVLMTCNASLVDNPQITNTTGQAVDVSYSDIDPSGTVTGGFTAAPGDNLLVPPGTSSGQIHELLTWPDPTTQHAADLTVGWYAMTGCQLVIEGTVR